MSVSKGLLMKGQRIPWSDIASGNYRHDIDDPYLLEILEFCRQWLHGMGSIVMQTSGSTGKPKEIRLSRGQLTASARATIRHFNLTSDDTGLVCLNTGYIGGKMMLVRGMEASMDLVITHPVSDPLGQVDSPERLSFISMVPIQWRKLAESGSYSRLEACRNLIIGGAPLSPGEESMAGFVHFQVFHTFGMTETASHFAIRNISANETTYRTLPGISIGSDDRGCLVLKGPQTDHRSVVTNDLAECLSDNEFRWIGRVDEVINTGGVKVQPREIEEIIFPLFREMNLNRRYFIAGIPDDHLGEKVALIIEGEPFDVARLLERIAGLLPGHNRPRSAHFVRQFAESKSGKISRKESAATICP